MGEYQAAAQTGFYVASRQHGSTLESVEGTGRGGSDPISDNAWKNTLFTFFDENKNR